MDSMGEGEGGKIWENGIETCKISCMKQEKKNKTSKPLFKLHINKHGSLGNLKLQLTDLDIDCLRLIILTI